MAENPTGSGVDRAELRRRLAEEAAQAEAAQQAEEERQRLVAEAEAQKRAQREEIARNPELMDEYSGALKEVRKVRGAYESLNPRDVESRLERTDELQQSEQEKMRALEELEQSYREIADELQAWRDDIQRIEGLSTFDRNSQTYQESLRVVAELEGQVRDMHDSRIVPLQEEIESIRAEQVTPDQVERIREAEAQLRAASDRLHSLTGHEGIHLTLEETYKREKELIGGIIDAIIQAIQQTEQRYGEFPSERRKFVEQVVRAFIEDEARVQGITQEGKTFQEYHAEYAIFLVQLKEVIVRQAQVRGIGKDQLNRGIEQVTYGEQRRDSYGRSDRNHYVRDLQQKFLATTLVSLCDGDISPIQWAQGVKHATQGERSTGPTDGISHNEPIAEYIRGHIHTLNTVLAYAQGLGNQRSDVIRGEPGREIRGWALPNIFRHGEIVYDAQSGLLRRTGERGQEENISEQESATRKTRRAQGSRERIVSQKTEDIGQKREAVQGTIEFLESTHVQVQNIEQIILQQTRVVVQARRQVFGSFGVSEDRELRYQDIPELLRNIDTKIASEGPRMQQVEEWNNLQAQLEEARQVLMQTPRKLGLLRGNPEYGVAQEKVRDLEERVQYMQAPTSEMQTRMRTLQELRESVLRIQQAYEQLKETRAGIVERMSEQDRYRTTIREDYVAIDEIRRVIEEETRKNRQFLEELDGQEQSL